MNLTEKEIKRREPLNLIVNLLLTIKEYNDNRGRNKWYSMAGMWIREQKLSEYVFTVIQGLIKHYGSEIKTFTIKRLIGTIETSLERNIQMKADIIKSKYQNDNVPQLNTFLDSFEAPTTQLEWVEPTKKRQKELNSKRILNDDERKELLKIDMQLEKHEGVSCGN